MWIVRFGTTERRALREDSEEDDSGGEQIHFRPLVLAAEMDFGSHIRESAKLRLHESGVVASDHRRRESKICNF